MLPNLPALAGSWDIETVSFTISASDFIRIALADTTRWTIDFQSLGAACNVQAGGKPNTLIGGWTVPAGQRLVFKYKDYGDMISQEWYVVQLGGTPAIQVCTVAIRPLTVPRNGE